MQKTKAQLGHSKNLIVIEIPKNKNSTMVNNASKDDLFRHKYMLMLQLKFCPFVKSIDFFYWDKYSNDSLDFSEDFKQALKHDYQFKEHAIFEIFYDNLTKDIHKLYKEVLKGNDTAEEFEGRYHAKLFSTVASQKEVKILEDNLNYMEWKEKAAKHGYRGQNLEYRPRNQRKASDISSNNNV